MGYEVAPLPYRVEIALDSLRASDQGPTRKAIEELKDIPWESPPRAGVRKISPDEPLYLVDATPDIRLFLRVDHPQRVIEVLDVVRQATLDEFARRAAASGATP
jgi:mRNA-degrading endonuclease RelE of RelBE toxin-antitoxin system